MENIKTKIGEIDECSLGEWDNLELAAQGLAIFYNAFDGDLSDSDAVCEYKSNVWSKRLDDGGHFKKADAHLIAAAPELLEALEKLVGLVAVGINENAYKNIVAGPDYPKRVLRHVEALLHKVKGDL